MVNLKKITSKVPDGSLIEEVYSTLHSKICYYFFGTEFLNILSPRSLIYCLLDPRFKHLSFASKDDAEAARQLLVNLHSKLHVQPHQVDNQLDDHKSKLHN